MLCSLEQEGDADDFCGQILSSNFDIKVWHSLDLWCFQDNWELKNKSLNHDGVSDLQVVALEKGLSSRFTIPIWMTIQNVFSQSGACFLFLFPVVLNTLKSDVTVPS